MTVRGNSLRGFSNIRSLRATVQAPYKSREVMGGFGRTDRVEVVWFTIRPLLARPESIRLAHRSASEGTKATIRRGPPLPPSIFIGRATT